MTKQIMVGGVPVGGGAPVTIQSMTNTRTDDVTATLEQIRRLAAAGCEIIRVAVPDQAAARAVGKIKEESPIPVVVDIHFDYKLALEAIAAGADKVRINPGNIGSVPALDGGRIFFLLLNGVLFALFRKKIPAKYEGYVHMIGMAGLLALSLVVTFSDIGKLFGI